MLCGALTGRQVRAPNVSMALPRKGAPKAPIIVPTWPLARVLSFC